MHYEETDVFKNNGVNISGAADSVQSFIADMTVLEKRKLGKQLKIMVDEVFTEDLKARAETSGLTVEKAPFQDYLINLTKKESNIHELA